MGRYRYTGEDTFFVKNGEILEGHLTTWSVKAWNGKEWARENQRVFYVKNAGYDGKDMGINECYLEEIES
jgi:pantothenate kinase